MGNLIRMNLYRMRKSRGFWVCLILTFAFALASTPLSKLMSILGGMLSDDASLSIFTNTINLSDFLYSPIGAFGRMLAFLAACSFFYADIENGYIKNIAGQMPRLGYTVLSKYMAAIALTLVFTVAALAGQLLGSLPFQRIVLDGGILDGLRMFILKFLLMQGVCAILLLFTGSLGIKSLGTVLSVLFGLGLMSLIYLAIDAGIGQVFRNTSFSISDYMPDQLLGAASLSTVKALVVAAVTNGLFLWLAVRVFDRQDVK